MIRIAAIADVHFAGDSRGILRKFWARLHESADILLMAGDLTTLGQSAQAAALGEELQEVQVPIVAVLGNHEYHAEQPAAVRLELEKRGVTVLEGESTVVRVGDQRVGIAGTKGFGGGFPGAALAPFGEPEMKAFAHRTEGLAEKLENALRALDTEHRIALMHYSPVKQTIVGEAREIFPFLGSYLLAEAVDRAGASLAIHGHAHRGQEKGITPGGVPVRNVAMPLLGRPYALFHLNTI